MRTAVETSSGIGLVQATYAVVVCRTRTADDENGGQVRWLSKVDTTSIHRATRREDFSDKDIGSVFARRERNCRLLNIVAYLSFKISIAPRDRRDWRCCDARGGPAQQLRASDRASHRLTARVPTENDYRTGTTVLVQSNRKMYFSNRLRSSRKERNKFRTEDGNLLKLAASAARAAALPTGYRAAFVEAKFRSLLHSTEAGHCCCRATACFVVAARKAEASFSRWRRPSGLNGRAE